MPEKRQSSSGAGVYGGIATQADQKTMEKEALPQRVDPMHPSGPSGAPPVAIKEEGVGMHSQMEMMGSNDMDLQNQSYMPLKMAGGQPTSRDVPSLDPSGVNPAGPFFSGSLGGLQHMPGANFGN